MKKVVFILSAAMVMLVTSAYTIQAIINWKIENEKAQVKFKMQAHGQELIGSFTGVKGDVKFDAADLANSSFNNRCCYHQYRNGTAQWPPAGQRLV
jgi:polyisoprenoid-binding protein YceI